MVQIKKMSTKKSTPQNCCLFVQYTAEVGGSPISGLSVVDVLQSSGMQVEVVFSVAGPLEKEYQARGCRIHYLSHGQWLVGGSQLRRLRRWGREAKATWQFFRLLQRLKPQLVYVNTLMSVAAVIAARLRGIPVIWHIREQFQDAGGEMHEPFGGRALVRAVVCGWANKVVCISKSVKDNVLGPKPCPKAQIIYNPLAASYFDQLWSVSAARAQLGLPENAFIVGLPGTLRPVKGHDFFIDTAADILAHDRHFHFAISGDFDNDYGRSLQERCITLGITDHIHFVGSVDDMRIFYHACDVVCVPSRGEPFGRTVIEAFAQRRPVIGTRVGGIPESIMEGMTGLLVDYGNQPALVAAIEQLRADTGLRDALAQQAFTVAYEHYHESVFNQRLTGLLATFRY